MQHNELDDQFIPKRSGSFRIIETCLPEAGVDFPRTRSELEGMFPNETACRSYLERLRWPRGFACGNCDNTGTPWRSGTGLMACTQCRWLVAVTNGSAFHGSCIPLMRWYRAIWEVTDQEAGSSVTTMQRVLRVREQQVALDCLDVLRKAMALPARRKLRRTVEVAKTYVEVEQRGTLRRRTMQKAVVALAVERERGDQGLVRAKYLPKVTGGNMVSFVGDVVEVGATVYTPPWTGYAALGHAGFNHRIGIHAPMGDIGHIVMPDLQQVSSLLRLWLWSAPNVTTDNLQRYIDEFTFRFNRRSYPRGLLFYRLMILATHFDTDNEWAGIDASTG